MTTQLNGTTYVTFEGTASDFEAQGVHLNGKPLNKVTVGAMAAHNLLETIGEGDKPKRGKTPKMFRAVSNQQMLFTKGE